MMLLLTICALLGTVCCPPTIPIWIFMLLGFHLTVRRQLRHCYISRHGCPPGVGTRDWFVVNF
ncbi:MAG: hypothetical protein IT204_23980 [Fimbriimonadaceae bacterium]|nr:hypothetical protein [Fimbriimonadaceae bacterium]